MSLYIGIDPGGRGAVVAINSDGACVGWDAMPFDVEGKAGRIVAPGRLARIIADYEDVACVGLEKATTRPNESTKSALTTGVFFGAPWGVIAANSLPHMLVRPQEWHSELCRGESGDPKERSIKVASRLWPKLPVRGPRGGRLDGFADAACIAEYVRRKMVIA